MTQNRAPSAWLVAILDQALFVEDWVRIYIASNDVLLVLSRSPSEVGSKIPGSHLEEGFKIFHLLPNMGTFLCFSRHHGCVFCVSFCPDSSDSKRCLLLPPFIFICFC